MDKLVEALIALETAGSLHHQVELNPAQALEFAAGCEGHGVDNESLVELVQRINNAVPPMEYGPSNPNTGKAHHKFYVGKEYSRVVYVLLVGNYFPDKKEIARAVRQIEQIGRHLHAQEVSTRTEGADSQRIRLWWD